MIQPLSQKRRKRDRFEFILLSLLGPLVFASMVYGWQGAGLTTKGSSQQKGQGEYRYDPTGKPDPFKPFFVTRLEALEKKKVKRRPRTYLETLELSQLDLIAIVIGPKGRFAMVRDAKGVGHVIKEGTPIGRNNGVVHKITQGEVVIKEEHTDFRGKKVVKLVKKKLPSTR